LHGNKKREVVVQEIPVRCDSLEDLPAGAVRRIKGIGDREFPPERVFTGFVVICGGVDTGHD